MPVTTNTLPTSQKTVFLPPFLFFCPLGVDRQPRALVTRRSRAKQKLNSAVVGASHRHAFDSEIFDLAIPTLGAVLVDPCLSLVDTGYVGRLGALSLAAIGPCTAAFNAVFITARCASNVVAFCFCFFRLVKVAFVLFLVVVTVRTLGKKQQNEMAGYPLLVHDQHRVKKSHPSTS